MKKMQNVLYILSQGKKLSVKNKSICISDDEGSVTVPVHNVESLVCFGNMSVTTPFMSFCSDNGVNISFLSEYGRYYGTFCGQQRGNVFLRTNQYKIFDEEEKCMKIASDIIETKIKNSIRVLEKSQVCSPEIRKAAEKMNEIRKNICNADCKEVLMGLEGSAANIYFSVFDQMINADAPEMKFEKRTRHPPENNLNTLLSFVYTLLECDVRAAVECAGLDVQAGVLHTRNYGKPSLVLDMMEEYRAMLCDRFVLTLINRKQVSSNDFTIDDGRILASIELRRKVIKEWQSRKETLILHTGLDEKIPIGLIPFAQAKLMSQYLRGETEKYIPFVWR